MHHVDNEGACTCQAGAACRSAGKHPTFKRWQEQASASGGDIEEWWRQRPIANVGIATGEGSGFFVLDIDPDNGGHNTLTALIAEHGELPPTYQVTTGSGGWHFYFAWPRFVVRNDSLGKLFGPGIDVRGNGGQVIAPPSRSRKGGYTITVNAPVLEAPGWVLDRVRPPERPTVITGPPVSTEVADRYAVAALANEIAAVREARPGTQNATLNRAAFALGTLIARGALEESLVYDELVKASTDSGYPTRDGELAMHRTIESGLGAGRDKPRTPWPPPDSDRVDDETAAIIREIYADDPATIEWLLGEDTAPAAPVPIAAAKPLRATDAELESFVATFTRYGDPVRLGRRSAWMRADAARPARLYRHTGALVSEVIAGHYPAARAVTALVNAYRAAGGTDTNVPRQMIAAALGAVLNAKVPV